MSKVTPNDSKKKGINNLRHTDEYFDFIGWIAIPKELRTPSTQKEYAKKIGVGEDTLSEWKVRDGFWNEVREKRKGWCKDKTSDVINALYKRILGSGSAAEVRLWMEVIEDWSSKEIRVIEDDRAEIRNMTDEELSAEKRRLRAFLNKTSDNTNI